MTRTPSKEERTTWAARDTIDYNTLEAERDKAVKDCYNFMGLAERLGERETVDVVRTYLSRAEMAEAERDQARADLAASQALVEDLAGALREVLQWLERSETWQQVRDDAKAVLEKVKL